MIGLFFRTKITSVKVPISSIADRQCGCPMDRPYTMDRESSVFVRV